MALVSVSVLGVPDEGDPELDRAIRTQLEAWYGGEVEAWELLRVDRIRHALPRIRTGRQPGIGAGDVLVCGDHAATPSIQGALVSGRRTAEALLAAR
jgi:predicted NAD/FAD-dependent oxidoreductase